MKSQILMAIGVAIVASVLVTGLASSIYAQSNVTGGNVSMPSASDNGESGDDDGEEEDNGGENEEDEGNN
jgi:hypothetical protein